MNDLELLYLVLALWYLWECACWLPSGPAALLPRFGRRWHPVQPGRLLANQSGGFLLAFPLPPLGHLLTAHRFPLALAPDAAVISLSPGATPPATADNLVRFDNLHSVGARRKAVLIDSVSRLRAPSPAYARYLVKMLERVRIAPQREREQRIAGIYRDQFDTECIRQRWRLFQDRVRPVRWLTNGLFLYLFVLTPALIGGLGLKRTWLGLLIGLLTFTAGTAVCFRRGHQALFPGADDDRFTHCLTILLSPATAIRAHDLLSRGLLETFHPLAIAQVLCPPASFRSQAAATLRAVRHPVPSATPAEPLQAAAAWRSAQSVLQQTVETFLNRHGLDPAELLEPPRPEDESCMSYCPRCQEQFTFHRGSCPDCGGVALVSFDRDPSPAAAGHLPGR
jgi:hypothetical protein